MHKNLLKFYVSLLIALAPLSALGDDEKPEMNRRSFLRGLIATAGAAAATPVIASGGSGVSTVPKAIKLQLAKLRVSGLRVSSDTIDTSLETYIDKLTQIMENTEPGRLKDFLSMRIEKAQKTMAVYREIQLNSNGEVPTDHSSSLSQTRLQAEQERLKQLHKDNLERIKNLGDLESVTPDVRLVMIRGLLDTDLMNRMVAQNIYGVENSILSNPDVSLLIEYKRLLEATIDQAPETSLVAKIAPQFLVEVNLVLESSPLWHSRQKGSSLSCGKFF